MIRPGQVNTASDVFELAQCVYVQKNYGNKWEFDEDFKEEVDAWAKRQGLTDQDEIIRQLCDMYDGAPDSKSPRLI